MTPKQIADEIVRHRSSSGIARCETLVALADLVEEWLFATRAYVAFDRKERAFESDQDRTARYRAFARMDAAEIALASAVSPSEQRP